MATEQIAVVDCVALGPDSRILPLPLLAQIVTTPSSGSLRTSTASGKYLASRWEACESGSPGTSLGVNQPPLFGDNRKCCSDLGENRA